jgi:tetratricopeptide (TPR) repeat protein
MGGMGKTALAREAAAWWLRTGRFDGAVFCSFEQRAGAERAAQLIGPALEGVAFSARASADQWQTAVALFHQRRVLVVWDNFESTLPAFQRDDNVGATLRGRPDAGGQGNGVGATLRGRPDAGGQGNHTGLPLQTPTTFGADAHARLLQLYRELTDGAPKGRLLVTCRPAETGLPNIKEIPLSGLARPDSLHLLAAVLDQKSIHIRRDDGADRAGYERAEIDALMDALDDHPLSIELVAPHLKTLTPKEIRAEFGKHLARFADDRAAEGRNKSLLASLAFSTQRLSADAQAVLPYLAWFEGGVFEAFLLAFAQLDAERWAAIRNELVATALVSVEEEGIQINKRPYLRFHPTLPYAARADAVPNLDEAEQRFIAVYLNVMRAANSALRGNQPAAGMALVAREEANLRDALHRAFRRAARQEGQWLADTLRYYLERAGRLCERDALVEWVRAQMPEGGALDEATWAAILQQAWSRFTQGHADEAIKSVQDLIARLEKEGLAGGADARFQIASSYWYLGRIFVEAHRPDLAMKPLQKAIALFEQLPGDVARGNLSAALGDLANAYRQLGQFDAAMDAAERALAINRELKRDREIAASLGQIAAILTQQQRYAEADARYAEALRAAQSAGDLGLQGSLLQHQASLQDDIGNQDRAVELYKQAIALFQRAANAVGEMQTCDLLATAERARGQLDAAEAWYARSRELALQLNDRHQLAANAQNVGILYQTRAEQATDPARRAALLRQAVASVQESLDIELERHNQIGAAESHSQLGILYRMLGELDPAEEHARQALKIRESLNLPDVYKDYGNLANIARARGDAKAAARWQSLCDAKVKELERLRRGDKETSRQVDKEQQLAQLVLALAQAAYQARVSRAALPPDAAEVLAQLADAPPPLGAVGTFLQDVAAGKPVPAVPRGLPAEVEQVLRALGEAVK